MEAVVAVSQADIPRLGVHPCGFQEGAELHAGRTHHIGPVALLRKGGLVLRPNVALNRRHRLAHHFTCRGGATPFLGRRVACAATRT